MNSAPIAFMDSGVGGLTVLREAMRQLPHEDVIFLGDQARLPYGPRPAAQVREFSWQMTNFLRRFGIKMLVIACNTATAAALEDLRSQLDIPVVGVIVPGARAAVKATASRKIGVIATEGTVRSGAYAQAIKRRTNDIDVVSMAAPKFVPLVESNEYKSPIAKKVVAETLQPLLGQGIDTLVMGCTHYPLLRPFIQDAMGPDVKLIDSGRETVGEVSVLLDYFNLATDKQTTGSRRFFTTGSPEMFKSIAGDWLAMSDIDVQHVDIESEPTTYQRVIAAHDNTIVVASTNKGKIAEIGQFFADRHMQVVGLDAFPNVKEVDESGTTFEENARLKADGYSKQLHMPVIADDSGLMVDALDGAPGVFSARYAGQAHNDAANNAKLLASLADTPKDKRQAQFRSVLVLARPDHPDEDIVASGSVHGEIVSIPRGDNGFGYDPFFFLPELGMTMAELSVEQKNEISHRGVALRNLGQLLNEKGILQK